MGRRADPASPGGRHSPLVVTLLVGLPLTVGCDLPGSDPNDTGRVVRADSAGIEVITSRLPASDAGDGWTVDPTPVLRLGSIEGSPEETFHNVVAVQGRDERVFVAQQTELRIYDEDGALVERLGGAGQGPGEFSRIASALDCGDHKWATDLIPSRVTVFDSRGQPSTRRLPPPERPGRLNPLILVACSFEGVIGSMAGDGEAAVLPTGVERADRVVVRIDEPGADPVTLMSFRGQEVFSGLRVPFGRATLFSASDSLLYFVDTGKPEVRIHGLDGSLDRVVRLSPPTRSVVAEDVERIRSQYLEGAPPDIQDQIRTLLDEVPIPETMPYFSRLVPGVDGSIWLQRYQPFRDELETRWTVVGSNGEWLGDVELPEGLALHAASNEWVLGVWTDELDVEYVKRYRLEPRGP